MLNAIMQSVIILNVVMLSVLVPLKEECLYFSPKILRLKFTFNCAHLHKHIYTNHLQLQPTNQGQMS
jgi:hypothetical protein